MRATRSTRTLSEQIYTRAPMYQPFTLYRPQLIPYSMYEFKIIFLHILLYSCIENRSSGMINHNGCVTACIPPRPFIFCNKQFHSIPFVSRQYHLSRFAIHIWTFQCKLYGAYPTHHPRSRLKAAKVRVTRGSRGRHNQEW